ncbi:MAG: DUF4199 domain-containing protein [Acidobacteriota bacterium]|nr:DUF4199 domain-containing protein [Acidobacteriota bacterium]
MRKIIWTFGLIAGAVMSVMMLATVPFMDRIGFDKGQVIGYTTMVLSFLMVYFGIRTYRDKVAGGTVTFGRAFRVGILITIISCVCYVATWQIIYYKVAPDFIDKYAAHTLDKAKASGASQQELDAQRRKMDEFKEMYSNPFVNAAITFVEPFPVGLVVTLICAGILKRKPEEEMDGMTAPLGMKVSDSGGR